MNNLEGLKKKIEKERNVLNQMIIRSGMTEVLEQSRKLDRMIETYLDALEEIPA